MYKLGAVCEVGLVCEDASLLRRSELDSESILLWWFGWDGSGPASGRRSVGLVLVPVLEVDPDLR